MNKILLENEVSQTWSLQFFSSFVKPPHCRSSDAKHLRLLETFPVPQVFEHDPQLDQSDQAPGTKLRQWSTVGDIDILGKSDIR